MKLYKNILLATIITFISFYTSAQDYSQWITASNLPTLKVRYKMAKNSAGYNFIYLELSSAVRCRVNVTTSACSADGKDKNGWQLVMLGGNNKTVVRAFKILNSCSNGFWWWYKDYSKLYID